MHVYEAEDSKQRRAEEKEEEEDGGRRREQAGQRKIKHPPTSQWGTKQ